MELYRTAGYKKVHRQTSFSEPPSSEIRVFSKNSIYTKCRFCRSDVMTSITYKPGKLSVIVGSLLCISGCCLGCCILPCYWNRFRDVVHICPECNRVIGRYHKV